MKYHSALKGKEIMTYATVIDDPWRLYTQWNKPIIHTKLCDTTWMRHLDQSFVKTKGRIVGAMGWWEGGNGELIFKEYRVSVWEGGKVLEMGGGSTTMWVYLMPLNCTFKNG